MTETVHIIVTAGPDKGLKITVPPQGIRIGRSSKNDVSLNDPELSRHHCRIFYKSGDGLWVSDLGSANHTIVDDKTIQEVALKNKSCIVIGTSTLEILDDCRSAAANATRAPAIKAASSAPVVDLGLDAPFEKPAEKKSLVGLMLIVLTVACAVAIAAWLPKYFDDKSSNNGEDDNPDAPIYSLEIDYEKIEANVNNIFRYHLKLDNNDILTVQIDDLENNEHIQKDKSLSSDFVQSLSATALESGFFKLKSSYIGRSTDIHNESTLIITVNEKTKKVVVRNLTPPQEFLDLTTTIEDYCRRELGLQPIQYSVEKRTQMANDALVQGLKLYDEKQIKFGNLAAAISSLSQAEWFIESVDPKPDFYQKIVASLKVAKIELDKEYEERKFRSDQSIKTENWEQAAQELRIILELIPTRSDKRYKETKKSLLYVEEHLLEGN